MDECKNAVNPARSSDAIFSKHRKQLRNFFKKSREIEEECLHVDVALARGGVLFRFISFVLLPPRQSPLTWRGCKTVRPRGEGIVGQSFYGFREIYPATHERTSAYTGKRARGTCLEVGRQAPSKNSVFRESYVMLSTGIWYLEADSSVSHEMGATNLYSL